MKKYFNPTVWTLMFSGFWVISLPAHAGKVHIVNQVAKTFVGEASDEKLRDYSINQEILRSAKIEVIKIKAGDSIEFKNADTVTHNAYGKDGEFDLKTQPIGKSDVVEFPKKGKVKVLCGIHPKMKLEVEVE